MNRKFNLLIAGLLLLLTSGCYVNQALYNPYAFAPHCPYTYFFPPKTGSEIHEITAANIPPEDYVLSLAEIIDYTLRNTPETTQSWAAARVAATEYGQTQAAFLPEIDAVNTYTRAKVATPTRNAITNKRIAVMSMSTVVHPELQLSYTIFDFGQRRLTSESARYALYFADWTHNRTIQTIVQTVTNNYYNYLLQVKLLESQAEDIETAETTLKAAMAEKLSGTKGIADVLQAKTLLLSSQLDHAAQKKLVQSSYSTLLNTMGIPSNAKITFEDLPKDVSLDILLKGVETLIADALVLRPDLRAQEADVLEKEAALGLAITKFFPTLSYQVNWGRSYFKEWVHNKNDWSGVMTLSIPLFSGFSKVNEVRKARANKATALSKLRETELQITKEITTSHTNVHASSDTIKFSRSFLDSATDQYEVALRKYRSGLGTIIDVASAQSSLANARSRHADAMKGWYSALADLVFATGFYTFKPEEVLE